LGIDPSDIQRFQELARAVDDYERTHQLETVYSVPMTDEEFGQAVAGELEPDGRPYPWAVKFHNEGARSPDRALLAANRVGKTRTCGAEIAFHATGDYPDWWQGRRFHKPTSGCVCGETNEQMRDIQQFSLYGGLIPESSDPSGTGWIPKDRIISWTYRVCGIKGVFDEVKVRHISGGVSTIKHKAYEQGWTKFQGTEFDYYWIDEEPQDQKIWPEILRGTFNTGGIILFSRTPTFGMTELVTHFMETSKSTFYMCVSLDEAPHMTKEQKQRFIEGIPDYEIETRTKGIPMMGSGVVYPISDDVIKCDPFDIPTYWRRIVGIDFGVSHPTAVVWLAQDPDSDVVYLYDCYQSSDQGIPYHASMIKAKGDWIPVAWPHDGGS
jgi:phage terminase large subunit-like protein